MAFRNVQNLATHHSDVAIPGEGDNLTKAKSQRSPKMVYRGVSHPKPHVGYAALSSISTGIYRGIRFRLSSTRYGRSVPSSDRLVYRGRPYFKQY